MSIEIGDIVLYTGEEFDYQWKDYASAKVEEILEEQDGIVWVKVRFPDSDWNNYPIEDLVILSEKQFNFPEPEFDLEDMELAEILMEEIDGLQDRR